MNQSTQSILCKYLFKFFCKVFEILTLSRYPNCLFVLSLLKEPRFRKDIAREDVSTMFMDDFYMRWLKKTTNPEGDIEKMAKETNPPADSTTIKTEPGK